MNSIMISQRRLAVAGLVALAATLATARPQARDVPRMELADVLGRTVCPLAVLVDDDPLRLPRRIKFMRCDRDPARRCPVPDADAAPACCHHRSRRHDYVTQCVEVFDNVVVQFLPYVGADARNATHHVVQVPVGCACVVQTGTPAQEDV